MAFLFSGSPFEGWTGANRAVSGPPGSSIRRHPEHGQPVHPVYGKPYQKRIWRPYGGCYRQGAAAFFYYIEEKCLRRQTSAESSRSGSGLRRCELTRFDVEDIDFDGKQVYVNGKGGKTRIVPLTATAVSALSEYIALRHASRGPLFVTVKGRRLHGITVNLIYHKKYRTRPHLLRHACATHLLKNGCDLRLIQQLLGHEHLTTTQRYTHILPVDVATAVERLHPRAVPAEAHSPSPETAAVHVRDHHLTATARRSDRTDRSAHRTVSVDPSRTNRSRL
jgi:hypothetical protein